MSRKEFNMEASQNPPRVKSTGAFAKMHDSFNISWRIYPSLRRFDLFLLGLRRPFIVAPFPVIRIPIRIRHLVVAPAALVCRVILLGHI